MAEVNEMEQLADLAVSEILEFISIEDELVKKEHELSAKLDSVDYVLIHLDERIPLKMKKLHNLNKKVTETILEIRALIEKYEMGELRIKKEEKQVLTKLKEDIIHKNWRAVKSDMSSEARKEQLFVRLEISELKAIHSKFLDLIKTMEKGNLLSALKEENISQKEKEAYEKVEEYYFVQIYKFAKFYQSLFEKLLEKEKFLLKKLNETEKKIK